MASITNRVNEANKFLENGHKFMKTGLLKWTPDHDNAAYQFSQAAMSFKGAGLHQKAIEANDLAIKCYLASQSSAFQAAKCMEQAALSHKELGDFQAASRYYMRAIDIYRTSGHLDTAISTMDRAAKALTDKMPSLAADIYEQASEACSIEDRYRQAAEYCQKAALLYVRSKEYQRAVNISKAEYNCYAQVGDMRHSNRIAMCLILLYLCDKNIVGANEILKSYQMDGDTYQLAQNLVKGYDKKDARLLHPTLSNSYFNNLDNEYAKIARDLHNTYGQVKPESPKMAACSNSDVSPVDEIPPQDEDLLL